MSQNNEFNSTIELPLNWKYSIEVLEEVVALNAQCFVIHPDTIEHILKESRCWLEPFGVYPEVPKYYNPDYRDRLAFAGSRR